jgi:FkbM family methyltransferase
MIAQSGHSPRRIYGALPLAQACQASALYDASHRSDDVEDVETVLEAERTISLAGGREAEELMKQGASSSSVKTDPGGHEHLWAALLLARHGKLADAVSHFEQAMACGLHHWRLNCYLAGALAKAGRFGEAFLTLNEARQAAGNQSLVLIVQRELLGLSTLATDRNQCAGAPEAASVDDYQFDTELCEQQLVHRLVTPGMTVFDIGANVGKYTQLFSLLVGERGRVFAFEPSPGSVRRLQVRIGEAKLKNVRVVSKAVCNRAGYVTLNQFPEEYATWNSIGRPQMEDPKDLTRMVPIESSVEVESVTLDEFCREQEITQIDYLKLDVEGVEILALQGSEDLLRRKAIKCLQFEVSKKMLEGMNTCAKPVFKLLEAHGYKCHNITAEGYIGDRVTDSNAFYQNYIAFPGVMPTSSGTRFSRYEEVRSVVERVPGLLCPGQEEFLFSKVCSLPDDAIIVEIGSFKGRSTVAMGLACIGTRRRLICIDTWEFENWEGRPENYPEEGTLPIWKHNIRHSGIETYVTPVRSYSHEALKCWPELGGGRQIDFVFIDGSHEYAAVLRDFEMAIPLVKPGGWIALHDVIETWPGPLRVWREHAAPVLQAHEFSSTLACGRKPLAVPGQSVSSPTIEEDCCLNNIPNACAIPRFSFVTIVLNGMPFIEFAMRAVYDFAHEIVIVEGAVKDCLFAANLDGSSSDGTVECIRNFPDPLKKIRLIQGQWPEKCEMQNAALEHVTGDYVWLMDSDEVYRCADLEKVRQLVRQDSSITQVNLIPDNFWKGFDYIFVSPKFLDDAAHYRRIFKYVAGAKFSSHRPPTMVHPGSMRGTEQINCIPGDVTRALGIVPFHYSYVAESQVAQKIELYNRYGWGKQWQIDMNEWFRECWQKWTPENRTEIESRYPVWTGGCDSRTAPFTGEHPEVMREFIQRWRCRNSPSSPDKTQTQVVQPSRRLKVAGDVATKADLTQVDSQSAFALAIRKLFAEIRPTKIIETGTYLGTGTTKVIAEAIRDLKLQGAMLHSIEVNPRHLEIAKGHLQTSGLSELVQLQLGLSVPRRLLPSLRQIQEQTVSAVEFEDLFVDHQEHERALLYLKETDFGTVPEDLLGRCLRQFANHPDFVLLDSGGHMGHVEFKYLLSQLAGSCYIALDDIHHVKHHRSFRQMQNDPRFEIIVSSKEKFGFCIAKFTPTAIVPDLPKSILWVRTDSIGDAVLAASVLPLVRQRFPKARISVLCQEHLAELYLTCPHIESIVCYNKQKAAEDTAYRDSIVAEIRSVAPDLILNSIYSRESSVEAMLQLLQGISAIGMEGDLANITFSEREVANRLYTKLLPNTRGDGDLELDHHRDFLAGLGIQTDALQPAVWLTSEDEAGAAALFAEHGLDPAHTIALFPGAQNTIRVYPRYVEALKGLKGFRYVLLGGEKDASLCEQIAAELPGQPVNLAGRTKLRELAALIGRCRLYVGADTSAAHLACAMGIPNVVVVGGGGFIRFFPYSPLTSIVAAPLECLGCFGWRCPHPRAYCIKDIPAEVLAEAVRQTLAARSEQPRVFVPLLSSWSPDPAVPARVSLDRCFQPNSIQFVTVTCIQTTNNTPRELLGTSNPSSKGLADRPARQSNPVVEYQEGFYAPEGEARWMGAFGRMRILTAEPGCLRLTLTCSLAFCYDPLPLVVHVTCDGMPQAPLSFQGDEDRRILEMSLPGGSSPVQIEVRASSSFVPFEKALNSDRRRLSVRLDGLEFRANAVPAASELSVESSELAAAEQRNDQDLVCRWDGFYDAEGDWRWLNRKGEICIPKELLQASGRIKFKAACSLRRYYNPFPFDVRVYLNGQLAGAIVFEADNHTRTCELELPDAGSDLHLRFETDQSFVPSASGPSNDHRHLSIRIGSLELLPAAESPLA